MENTYGTSGVPTHELHEIFDATKIKMFMRSPRMYFHEYILGHRPIKPNVHLIFGGAIHESMEIIHKDGFTQKSLQDAIEAFYNYYSQYYPDEEAWDMNHPKTPGAAIEVLKLYFQTYQDCDANDQVLYTEVSGAMPVNEKYDVIHFKIDSIIKDGNKYFSREHKTTGRMGATWESTWYTDFQVDTYNYALNMLLPVLTANFGKGYSRGVVINGMGIFKSKSPVLKRVPVFKPEQAIDKYRNEVTYWIDQIRSEMEVLAECKPSDPVLCAFPCNTESCKTYGGCKIADLCNSHFNPLQDLSTPVGMVVDLWDPRGQGKTKLEEIAF